MNTIKKASILFLSVMTLYSCKTTKDKSIEYVTDPISEVQTHAEKDSVPNQRQRVKGEWIVLKAMGRDINAMENRAYIDFNAKESKIYGFTGCNYINGGFKMEGNDNIAFSNVITTSKYCDAISDEIRILQGMERAFSFVVYRKSGLYYMDIQDSNGKTVMHTKRHNADVMTGTWKVTAINGKTITGEQPLLVIDVPELKLHGKVGCNIINGAIGLDRNKDWFVQFQGIASTRSVCDKEMMDMQRDLLVSLEEVEQIVRINFDKIRLNDKDKNEVLMLERTNISTKR